MSANDLPDGWTEVFNTPDSTPEIEEAIDLLKDSFPAGQYDSLTLHYVLQTMIPRQVNGYFLFNLRIFLHADGIAAFFFLRKRYAPVAYCLSPGADEVLDAASVLAELVALCTYMKNEPNAPVLDIVSETNPPVFAHQNLTDAFAAALQKPARLNYRGEITPGEPWPPKLHRWEILV